MKNYLKFSFITIPSTFLIMVGFNNCSRFEADSVANPGNSTFSSESSESTTLGSSESPYALLSAEQTLASMLKVTNVATVTPAIRNEYNLRYGGLAAGTELGLANAPLMLGSTSLAGAVCGAMIAQEVALEASTRPFFSSINFATGIKTISDASFYSSVRGMARSFWGRNETSAELMLLSQYKSEFLAALDTNAANQAVSTSNLMVGVCAAMLSSVDALSY